MVLPQTCLLAILERQEPLAQLELQVLLEPPVLLEQLVPMARPAQLVQ